MDRMKRLEAFVRGQYDDAKRALFTEWATQRDPKATPAEIAAAAVRQQQLIHQMNACEWALRQDDSTPVRA